MLQRSEQVARWVKLADGVSAQVGQKPFRPKTNDGADISFCFPSSTIEVVALLNFLRMKGRPDLRKCDQAGQPLKPTLTASTLPSLCQLQRSTKISCAANCLPQRGRFISPRGSDSMKEYTPRRSTVPPVAQTKGRPGVKSQTLRLRSTPNGSRRTLQRRRAHRNAKFSWTRRAARRSRTSRRWLAPASTRARNWTRWRSSVVVGSMPLSTIS